MRISACRYADGPNAASRDDHETEIMDILFFFKKRTDFIRRFYEDASLVFTDTMSKIEDGKPPYDEPDDLPGESMEPPYQAEWGRALARNAAQGFVGSAGADVCIDAVGVVASVLQGVGNGVGG